MSWWPCLACSCLPNAPRTGGGGGGVNLAWEIWRFNLAAKFPMPNPGASCFVLPSLCFACSMSRSLFFASAKFPTAQFTTTKLTRHQIPPPPRSMRVVKGSFSTFVSHRRDTLGDSFGLYLLFLCSNAVFVQRFCVMGNSGASSELVQQMRDEMELHMSALQAKQEGESMLKQQIMELSSKVDELQDDLYKQQAFGESLQVERDELRETLSQREADFEKMQVSAASLRQEESHEQEAELERMRESMAALSQVLVFRSCARAPPARIRRVWPSCDPPIIRGL